METTTESVQNGPQSELMTAFFAAVTAIEEGKVAEVEFEREFGAEMEENYSRMAFTVRKEVQHFHPAFYGSSEEDDD